MWVKVGNDYINLSQVARVRFGKGWNEGVATTVAEVETLANGDLKNFTRYRGRDAENLQAALQKCSALGPSLSAGEMGEQLAPATIPDF